MVTTRVVESDTRLPQEPKRTTLFRYWGPTYHELNRFWGGFQVKEVIALGDATQATQIKQTLYATGRIENPYLRGPTLETIFDEAGRKFQTTRYRYRGLGQYLTSDPYNFQKHTFRSVLTGTEFVLFGKTEEHQLKNASSNIYEFDGDLERYRKAPFADEAPVRLESSCVGRACKKLVYEGDHLWVAGSHGISLSDHDLVKEERTTSQASGKLAGLTTHQYYPDSGLLKSTLKCGDASCSAEISSLTQFIYDDQGYLFKEIDARGGETIQHRNKDRPWLVESRDFVLPQTAHEPKKIFLEEFSGLNEAETAEDYVDIQGLRRRSIVSAQSFVLKTSTYALGSDKPFKTTDFS
ncbi:MAG: hypothetical protein EOP09_18605, partial [Proteobacteria bacterium]